MISISPSSIRGRGFSPGGPPGRGIRWLRLPGSARSPVRYIREPGSELNGSGRNRWAVNPGRFKYPAATPSPRCRARRDTDGHGPEVSVEYVDLGVSQRPPDRHRVANPIHAGRGRPDRRLRRGVTRCGSPWPGRCRVARVPPGSASPPRSITCNDRMAPRGHRGRGPASWRGTGCTADARHRASESDPAMDGWSVVEVRLLLSVPLHSLEHF